MPTATTSTAKKALLVLLSALAEARDANNDADGKQEGALQRLHARESMRLCARS